MKKFVTFAALLSIASFSLFAADTSEEIVDLPAHQMHYGSIPALVDQTVPAMPNSISGIDGYVLLQFDISENGRVSDIMVVKATNDKLAKYSQAMVRRWTFDNPGARVTAHQPIIFETEKDFPTLLAIN